jgi:hypothetical protein
MYVEDLTLSRQSAFMLSGADSGGVEFIGAELSAVVLSSIQLVSYLDTQSTNRSSMFF